MVAPAVARYDEFAEWYAQWIGDTLPLIAAQAGLLPAVTGERVLDLACGQGRMSRFLAQRGAQVTGVDISAAMLARARAQGPEDITYVHGDVTRRPGWWDGRPFDGCTCELALMDIDDLTGALATVSAVLRPAAGSWPRSCIRAFPATRQGAAAGRRTKDMSAKAGGPRQTTIPAARGSGSARPTASCPPS